jgi:PKD repeat protein
MHNGGAMAFGNDGYIYLTIGDGGSREPAYSQDLRILYGSVIRIDENGIAPRDNPFTVESGGTGVACAKSGGVPPKDAPDNAVCEEIFAYGLRNPFRLAMDVNTKDKVLFHVGDVGASHWEEINKGGTDFKAVNYGWPIQEGPCRLASTTECTLDEQFTDPFYYYQHVKQAEGGCVTGAAFVPEGLWPEQYKYLFVDFIFGNIYNLIADPDNECRECVPPIPAYRNETFYSRDIMVDIFFGPYKDTQALYVISRNEGQSIRRIHYSGSSNRAPVAVINASTVAAGIGDVILFDGSSSSDVDDDELSFLWDFGDGTISKDEITEHAFTNLGQYTVTLTVVDSKDQNNQVFIIVVVGEPPVASIELPIEGIEFIVGQEFRVKGSAFDFKGNAIPDSQLTWEVRQHHGDHFHPFLESATGNNFDLDPAPAPEDFSAATNSYLEIILHATDDNGLTSTISRNIQPKKVIIDIDSDPQGLQVFVDEFGVITPANITSWVNHELRLNAINQGEYMFQSWSIGGDKKTTYTVPDEQSTNEYILATFVKDSELVTTPTATPSLAPFNLITISPTLTPFTANESEVPMASDAEIDEGNENMISELVPLIKPTRPCTKANPCERCEGDCNSDDDCVDDLVCFKKGRGKDGDAMVVPGCFGVDTSRTDWCTTKEAISNA